MRLIKLVYKNERNNNKDVENLKDKTSQNEEQSEQDKSQESGQQTEGQERQQQSEGQEGEQPSGEEKGEGQDGEEQQDGKDGEKENGEEEQKDGESQEVLDEEKPDEEEQEPEEEKEPDAKKSFRELLKYDVSQNTSKGIGNPSIPNLSLEDEGEIPDSVIRTLYDKFLNQTFTRNVTDLNFRGESLKQAKGNLRWDIPKLIRDKVTMQYQQMLTDKYGYEKENGRDEKIPLAIYFDLSESMDAYAKELSIIALKSLRAGVKVLIGENELIEMQIDNVPTNFSADDMLHIFNNKRSPKDKTEVLVINRNIKDYLKEKKAERAIVFSDFDPKQEIERLSEFCKVYWFCTEERDDYRHASLDKFKRIIL